MSGDPWTWMLMCTVAMLLTVSSLGLAEPATNYDETAVPPYVLPDPLRYANGDRVSDVDWPRRRVMFLADFETHVYGRTPRLSFQQQHQVMTTDAKVLGGRAKKKIVRVTFSRDGESRPMDICMYLPPVEQPVPVFVGIHLFAKDAEIPMPGGRILPDTVPLPDDIDPARLPGKETIFTILSRGYGIATIEPDGLAPDDAKRYLEGVIPLFWEPGQKARKPDEWGAIGAWAWGLSRALDYFTSDPDVDAKRVIAIGHSRRGKTALWAGAQDGRFAMVISNNSGCVGAALSKRRYGETVEHINRRFPHWFCENFRQYNGKEENLPVDQHQLIAAIAPRPVYIGSAQQDRWADPLGEFLAAKEAEPVYILLGKKGLGADKLPPLNQSIGDSIGYHIRTGHHALADMDWMMYLDFADRHLKR